MDIMIISNTGSQYCPNAWRKFLTLFLLVFFFGSCAVLSPRSKETLPAAAPPEQAGKNPERPAPGDGLDTPVFRNLPGEAKEYLQSLSGAFRRGDRNFLIAQGEAQYEKELRSPLDEETYLALLYRIGPYSEGAEWKTSSPPLLNISVIAGIEYTGWTENGPMLEISGRIHLQNDDPIPCRIILVWRLPDPKILGEWP